LEYSSDKHNLRGLLKQRRSLLHADERASKSHEITLVLLQSKIFQQAEKVHCYLSWGDEVNTVGIIQAALQAGKQVFCPYNLHKNGLMHHAQLTDIYNVQKGLWGIMEPKNPTVIYTSLASFSEEDIIIVPLLGFDKQLYRLGYGKGFYDRALQHTNTLTCGLAFSVQEVSDVFPQAHDQQLDEIITEQGFYKSNINNK
jgi:5-formyltetrahydrofolate cyclo-ligase